MDLPTYRLRGAVHETCEPVATVEHVLRLLVEGRIGMAGTLLEISIAALAEEAMELRVGRPSRPSSHIRPSRSGMGSE